ncbi:hypothetical protein DQ04_00441020 [Trypanosoma grayi]|uniref:hypothetical protein n=1 Tax=Trypanosoma grayi TaxID=71804 RepID=UPI0004F48D44|nr:hypothetical protein DQ04_00441020 [Trypanosoma grayi]KEG14477.1 hypothetical protein DQ04_00441020 [Trypanosoma grayi]
MALLHEASPLPRTKNISLAVDGFKLHIYCDLSRDYGASTSKKTNVIASSSGNKALGCTNAFLGINVFCKNMDARRLDEEATAELREMTPMGSHCEWCVKGKTLCIVIDFKNLDEKTASSGKSVILASSGGNKPVGRTGIMCGLNCYMPLGRVLEVDKLEHILDKDVVAVGSTVDIGEGFVLKMDSDTQATVHYECLRRGEVGPKSMSPFTLNSEVALSLLLKMSSKKMKAENTTDKKDDGFFVLPMATNLLVRCETDDDDESAGTISLDVRFDPTQSHGPSATGKSIIVSSSGGWCSVGHGLSISFNAYKMADALNSFEIPRAVEKVLESRSHEEFASISFKTVLTEVSELLGLKEVVDSEMKEDIKNAVMEYVRKQKYLNKTFPSHYAEESV